MTKLVLLKTFNIKKNYKILTDLSKALLNVEKIRKYP